MNEWCRPLNRVGVVFLNFIFLHVKFLKPSGILRISLKICFFTIFWTTISSVCVFSSTFCESCCNFFNRFQFTAERVVLYVVSVFEKVELFCIAEGCVEFVVLPFQSGSSFQTLRISCGLLRSADCQKYLSLNSVKSLWIKPAASKLAWHLSGFSCSTFHDHKKYDLARWFFYLKLFDIIPVKVAI